MTQILNPGRAMTECRGLRRARPFCVCFLWKGTRAKAKANGRKTAQPSAAMRPVPQDCKTVFSSSPRGGA